MSNERNNIPDNTSGSRSNTGGDLTDSKRDQERLKPEETTIDLPDVWDIPGQENVTVPPLGELADTTISSDDEEGKRVFDQVDNDSDLGIRMGTEGDVSREEKSILRNTEFLETGDDDRLQRASLDSTDMDGEKLNERSFGEERSGSDLDIPEQKDDTRTDAMGKGDEENKHFSLGSDDNDTTTEGTP
jgi:hypothetical protein